MDCDIIVDKIELHLHFYFHFQISTLEKSMKLFMHPPPAMSKIIPQLFYKDGFGIK